jgi:quinol monooxygenase YgiN
MQKSTLRILVIGSTIVAAAIATPVCAQAPADAVYIATYVDVMPASQKNGLTLIKQFRDKARKADGNLGFNVVQELSRPNHFVMLAVWKDLKTYEASGTSAAATEFRTKLDAVRNSPSDERVNSGMSVTTSKGAANNGAIYVVTHVDVIPPKKDDAVILVKQLGEESRKDPGNIRFDVLQQSSRPNHFTVVEGWKNRKAFEAHVSAQHTRAFRDKLAPMGGALYDERLYKSVD